MESAFQLTLQCFETQTHELTNLLSHCTAVQCSDHSEDPNIPAIAHGPPMALALLQLGSLPDELLRLHQDSMLSIGEPQQLNMASVLKLQLGGQTPCISAERLNNGECVYEEDICKVCCLYKKIQEITDLRV